MRADLFLEKTFLQGLLAKRCPAPLGGLSEQQLAAHNKNFIISVKYVFL
jgi:hypothetical protein